MAEPLQDWANGDDISLWLARTWAEQTRRLVRETAQLRNEYRGLNRDFEHSYVGPDGYEVSEDRLNRAGRAIWAAECLLVISAWSLDVWMSKLYKARGRKHRKEHVTLRRLRNAIMHLDEGDLDEEGSFVLAKGTKSNHGLGALPEGRLSVGLRWDGRLFGILTPDELEALACSLLDELDAEFAELWGNFVDLMRD
ncbi:hypothetical protein G3H63_09200 [Microbacterium resistens]|uniref:hypothetical protein n=1 Tax=Microbacterium resistens TaxID=156977 RepID=UPI001C5635A5|nr:hypothetical protein [Microbacterium resistens]MBW1639246.1 hypothetical protein [Microbacterium resistens]